MTIILIISLGVIFLALYANYQINRSTSRYCFNNFHQLPDVKIALVLGAKVYPDQTLSLILADRVDKGIELYQSGKVEKLIFSGAHNKQENYDEVNAMKQYALNKGVPGKDILLDHAGFRTYDSLYRAKVVFLLKRLVVVTQKFHLNRAVYTGRKLGLTVYGISSDQRIYLNHWGNKGREFLARTKAFFELHFYSQSPRYLGQIIDTIDDVRQSHD